MGLRRDELLKRVARRENLKQDWKKLIQPSIDASDDDQAEFVKQTKALKKEYAAECYGVNSDVRLLDRGMDILAIQMMADRGMLPSPDGEYNNTVRDEIVDEALEAAWATMPAELRPPAPTPVQTKIEGAISEALAEKNEDGVELPVITLPPANGETGEEIAPTFRYQTLCAQAEANGIDRDEVSRILTDAKGETSEVDHGDIEYLTKALNELLASRAQEQATIAAYEILEEIDAGIDLANVTQVMADRGYDETTSLYFKIQEYASVHGVEQVVLTEWLKAKGLLVDGEPALVRMEFLVALAERVITWSKQGEAVVEEIVNETKTEEKEVAQEQTKKPRKPRTPTRRPGLKPAKSKSKK